MSDKRAIAWLRGVQPMLRHRAVLRIIGVGVLIGTVTGSAYAAHHRVAGNRGLTLPAQSPTSSSASCTPPGTVVLVDPASDQRDHPEHPDQDILSVSIAEPYAVDSNGAAVGELTFTIKVSDLSTISKDARWQVEWGTSALRHFVNMITDNGNVSFNYGHVDGGNNVIEGPLDCGSYDQAAGTITLTVSTNKVGSPQPGTFLLNLSANTRYILYIPGPFVVSEDETSSVTYTLQGNQGCSATTPMFCPPTTPTPLPSACNPPGNILVTDRANDSDIAAPPLPGLDILWLAIAEPYASDSSGVRVGELTFTIKVSDLTVVPPSASWYVIFNHGQFVNMMNDGLNVTFNYGHFDGNGAPVIEGPLDCGSFDSTDGTITLTISNSKLGNLQPGQKLLSVYAETFFDDPTGTPLSRVDYTFDKEFDYTVQGNQSCPVEVPNFCSPKPTPTPTPTPTATPNGFGYQPPGHTVRISKGYDGSEANGYSTGPVFSSNGRFVAFTSAASNLVPGDTNGVSDAFVYDRMTGKTERVSVATDGTQSDFDSTVTSISADGRFVAFASAATTLVSTPALDGSNYEIFVHDRQTGVTECVSVSDNGQPANDYTEGGTVSSDGRYVAFDSAADNLVPNDTNQNFDIFVRDRVAHKTEIVSVASDGTYGNGGSLAAVMTPDGRYVAFTTFSTNLGPGERGSPQPVSSSDAATLDIYVRDRSNGTTARAYTALDGGDGNAHSIRPAISANGRYVTFTSTATNFVPNGYPGGLPEIYVADRQTGEIEKIVAFDGERTDGGCLKSSISDDGRYVAFDTAGDNIVPNDSNGFISNVYVYDRVTKQAERVSVATDGSGGTGDSSIPIISGDAHLVGWATKDKTLVPDKTTNMLDIFVRDRGPEVGTVDLAGATNSNQLSVNGTVRLAGAIISSATDPANDGASNFGAELTGASVIYRPEEKDLYFRINLANIPTTVQQDPTDGSTIVIVGSPNVVYVASFNIGTAKYELRVTPPASTGAFELWSCDSQGCTMKQSLEGGFGTAGNDIRVAVPLAYLNLSEGQLLSGLHIEAGTGTSTATEPLAVYDDMTLPDATVPASSVKLGFGFQNTLSNNVTFGFSTSLTDGHFTAGIDLAQINLCQSQLFARTCVGSNCGISSTQTDLSNSCPLNPLKVVSRKTHAAAGNFDINLPLSGSAGVECRSGGSAGNYDVVFSFSGPLSGVSSAAVTAGPDGTASIAGSPSIQGSDIVVSMNNVTNAQTLTITLTGVTNGSGTNDISVPMTVLIGDTNADGVVDSADIAQTKSQVGRTLTLSNFREDLNADSFIDSADIAFVKSKSGTSAP